MKQFVHILNITSQWDTQKFGLAKRNKIVLHKHKHLQGYECLKGLNDLNVYSKSLSLTIIINWH